MPKFPLPLFLTFSICTAGIVFQKEAITVTITACDTLEVRGIYLFANKDTSAVSTMIYYPFPVDSSLKYPHYINVVSLTNHQQVGYVQKTNGINWEQTIPPRSIDSIQVIYHQKALRTNGRYILTTTQNWKKPLEQADFTVITPADITLKYWSFQTDSVRQQNGRIVYHSAQKNFFPESDMLLEWKCE